MALGFIGLLYLLFVAIVLSCFGLKGAGGRIGGFMDMEETNRKVWERLVGKSSDPCNVVTYANKNNRGVYYVTAENTRLGTKKVFGEKNTAILIKSIREQFEEWAKM